MTIESLRLGFVATLRANGSDWQRWATIFGLSTEQLDGFENPPAIPGAERTAAVHVIAGLGNDSPDRTNLDDQLGAEQEAYAFARIAAARSVLPPLAFGIFGEWGSGKSFFMRLMHKSVAQLSLEARNSTKGSLYLRHIVQIRFNAWHYAESNLWASLVNHIFVELDRWSEGESAAKGGLLGKLMTARKLSVEAAERLVAQRQQQKLAAERLAAARRELAVRREEAGGTPRMFWSAVRDSFVSSEDARQVRAAARDLGLAELADNAEDLKQTLDDVTVLDSDTEGEPLEGNDLEESIQDVARSHVALLLQGLGRPDLVDKSDSPNISPQQVTATIDGFGERSFIGGVVTTFGFLPMSVDQARAVQATLPEPLRQTVRFLGLETEVVEQYRSGSTIKAQSLRIDGSGASLSSDGMMLALLERIKPVPPTI